MSRIGRKPIAIPANVNVTVDGNKVTVAGPKGTLDSTFHAKMAIAVEGGNVVAVELVEHGETDGIYQAAEEGVVAEIIKKQTTEVDTVSGATNSSKGIMEAVAEALSTAK